MFDFRSGGWVLLLAGLLVVAVIAWRIVAILPTIGGPAIGDGKNPATYGFSLEPLLVPRDLLVGGGMARDGLPALNAPATMPTGDVDSTKKLLGAMTLVSADRVIGVTVGGESRAYPLWILNLHEIVNDTLGGVPIAVTYNGMCDSAVVFDRRMQSETLEFRVSGLLYNANLVMFDRREPRGGESLWSQLEARAIAGPAAADRRALRVLPSRIMTWADWRAAHQPGTVMLPDRPKAKRYKEVYDAYTRYFKNDDVDFPVRPLPPEDGWSPKTPMIAVRVSGGEWAAWKLPDIVQNAAGQPTWTTRVGERDVTLRVSAQPLAVWVDNADAAADLEVIYAFRFAWHASHSPRE